MKKLKARSSKRKRPPAKVVEAKLPKFRRALGVDKRLIALEGLLEAERPRSKLETAALQRQISDLVEGHRRGLVWDEMAAQRSIAFFGLLKHWKGEFAGRPFRLEAYQEHGIVAPLFGWKREDGLRRFRTAYIEKPRKNGKTFLGAGFALQGLVADQESGAEVYSAATKREQATICFNDAKKCLGPQLKNLLQIYAHSILFQQLAGTFRPLSSDSSSLDGLNIHRAIVDELHAHKTRHLWDVLVTAVGARKQPLIIAITTAGDDEQSICGEVRGLAKGVLEGKPDHDDALFAFISCAEIDDDWNDPQTWWKANPNLGISLTWDSLRDLAKKARASKAAENNFRRKHLNQWITGAAEWITPVRWAKCHSKEWPDLTGQEAFGAVDLGWRDDFAARGLIFPERIALEVPERPADEGDAQQIARAAPPQAAKCKVRRAWVDLKIWVPENGRRDIHQPPLVNWIEKGLVTVTPGNSTDIDAIFSQLQDDAQRYQLAQVAIDPNNARQLGNDLTAFGLNAFEFWQSIRNYHEPCMEFAALVGAQAIHHDGNELLAWMMKNVRLKQNSAGYVMPAKDKAPEKIDGPVALLMAFAMAMFADPPRRSFYEDNDLEIG